MKDIETPLKFKLFLTPAQKQAYRLAANMTNKESIADYIVHAIHTYTSFLIKELETQTRAQLEAEAKEGTPHVQANP